MQEWAVLNKLNDKTVQRVFGRVILGIKTCEVFLCFLAIIFLGFIVLTSYWLLCVNCFTSLFNNDNDFQDITSIRWFSVYLISGRTGISKCLLLRSEKKKNRSTRRKTSRSKRENQHVTSPVKSTGFFQQRHRLDIIFVFVREQAFPSCMWASVGFS